MNGADAVGPGRWRWAVRPAAIAIASRLFSIAVLVGTSSAKATGRNPLSDWDTFWYWRIVTSGYHADLLAGGRHDYAFFPGWPIAIKLASLGWLDPFAVSVVLANGLFLLAAVLIWRLLAERLDPQAATGGLALLAFAPASYVFSMGYSESLLLLLTSACLLVGNRWARALLAAGATFTRLAALALVVAGVAVAAFERQRRRLALATVLGALAGFSLWFAYVAVLTAHPLGFFSGASSWIHGSVLHHQAVVIRADPIRFAAWMAFVALVLGGSLLAIRDDLELGTFALASALVAIASFAAVSVNSIARYALPAFPAYAALARRLGPRWSWLLVVVFAAAEVIFVGWTIGSGRVPP